MREVCAVEELATNDYVIPHWQFDVVPTRRLRYCGGGPRICTP
jgi:hypothetical protein